MPISSVIRRHVRSSFAVFILLWLLIPFTFASAEECKMGSDLDGATKSALEGTAQRYFQMAAIGDATNLQQNSIPSVASNFGGIQGAIAENKANFGTSSKVRGTYELDAPGNGAIARAEFFCGIYNSPDHIAFVIPGLPAGRYALVMLDAQGGKVPMTVSMVLQQMSSGAWKLGGFYARPASLAGHDGQWYVAQARQYKAKNENHNAWFYYLTGWDLLAPVPFMSTSPLEKLEDEMQTVRPADLPGQQQSLDLSAAGKNYRVTQLFAVPVNDGLGLVVKHQVADISNSQTTFADNMAVIKALLAKYPEFREAFSSVVARAVAPSGQDYGTLLAMKDVK